MRLRFLGVFIFTIFLSVSAFATAQYPDKIFYDGKEYDLLSNPMELYFQKNPGRKPQTEMKSTALWRGYVASFEIKDGELLLKDVRIMVDPSTNKKDYERGWKSVLSDVVPDGKPLKIDWFAGLLVLPYGKLVNYVHMGYASTYENYILLEIAAGDFKKAKQFGHEEYSAFKDRQFEAFKKTDEYKKIVEDLKKNRNNSDEFIESFLKSFVTNYTSKFLVD